jgi:hypothetical protein
LNTFAQVGTALGLATLVTLAAVHAGASAGGEESSPEALVEGYRLAFFVASGVAVLGVSAALSLVRRGKEAPGKQ